MSNDNRLNEILGSFLTPERVEEMTRRARERMAASGQPLPSPPSAPAAGGGVVELMRRVNEASDLVMGAEVEADRRLAQAEAEFREQLTQARSLGQQQLDLLHGYARALLGDEVQPRKQGDIQGLLDSAMRRLNHALGGEGETEKPLVERIIAALDESRRVKSQVVELRSQRDSVLEQLPDFEGGAPKRASQARARIEELKTEAQLAMDDKASALERLAKATDDIAELTRQRDEATGRAQASEDALFPSELSGESEGPESEDQTEREELDAIGRAAAERLFADIDPNAKVDDEGFLQVRIPMSQADAVRDLSTTLTVEGAAEAADALRKVTVTVGGHKITPLGDLPADGVGAAEAVLAGGREPDPEVDIEEAVEAATRAVDEYGDAMAAAARIPKELLDGTAPGGVGGGGE